MALGNPDTAAIRNRGMKQFRSCLVAGQSGLSPTSSGLRLAMLQRRGGSVSMATETDSDAVRSPPGAPCVFNPSRLSHLYLLCARISLVYSAPVEPRLNIHRPFHAEERLYRLYSFYHFKRLCGGL